MKLKRLLGGTSLLACAAMLASLPIEAAEVTRERLINADKEAGNWLMVHRTYDAHRYSPLNQINKDNVSKLRLAFVTNFDAMTAGGRYLNTRNESTPLVEDGFLYIQPAWSRVYKVDVRDGRLGKIIWKLDPEVDRQWVSDATCCGSENRGISFWGNDVIALTLDGRVMSINKDTGELNWEKQRSDRDRAESFTSAALVVEDTAIYGPAGGEYGIRGWLEALNLKTGEPKWRKHLIPAPGEPGHDTWKRPRTWETGGASIWQTGSYDPETHLTFWGTGNPAPQIDAEYRPGDNLYASSLVALDARTGEMKWHFQFTPNDPYDYDEIGEAQLLTAIIDGQPRKIAIRNARNGFTYAFDRNNGQFIYGKQYVDTLNWTTGLDPKTGRPLNYDPAGGLQLYAAGTVGTRDKTPGVYCPTLGGGKNWQPASLSARTGFLYLTSNEGCSAYVPTEAPNPTITGGAYNVIQSPNKEWNGRLPAPQGTRMPAVFNGGSILGVDPRNGAVIGKSLMPFRGNGVLATAGGLVFIADRSGLVAAYDDTTMKMVWSQNIGTSIGSPPFSYLANGKQYVGVVAGFQPAPIHLQNDPSMKFYTSVDAMYVLSID